MIRINKVITVTFRTILLSAISLSVSSCDLTSKVTIVEEYPLCIPRKQVVTIDLDKDKRAKEVIFYYDIKPVIPEFEKFVYIAASAKGQLAGSLFF